MMMTRRFLSLILPALCALNAFAEEPADTAAAAPLPTIADHIMASGTATVSQPAKLNERLRPVDASSPQATETGSRKATGGYRIQVYSGNNARYSKGEAQNRAAAIAAAFPEHATYVTYDAPYWRLRVGDFRTYEDASAALSVLKAQFPAYARELRLVRSKIKFSE